jgi:hypothetical protein
MTGARSARDPPPSTSAVRWAGGGASRFEHPSMTTAGRDPRESPMIRPRRAGRRGHRPPQARSAPHPRKRAPTHIRRVNATPPPHRRHTIATPRNRVTRGRVERHEQVCELDHHGIPADRSVHISCRADDLTTPRGRVIPARTMCRGGIRTHTSSRTRRFKHSDQRPAGGTESVWAAHVRCARPAKFL